MFPIEEQFRIIADTAPNLIWISGPDKLCYFFNAGWLRFRGRTMEEEYGNGWTEGVHPDDFGRCVQIYFTAFDAREPFKMEYRLQRYDGQYRWIIDHGVPRYTADGAFAGYIGSCMDIDELLESERIINAYIPAEALKREQALNEEMAAANEELAATNEELAATNEELQQTQESLTLLNNTLEETVALRTKALTESEAEAQALNEELTASNEELAATNEELMATNEELSESRERLQMVLDELVLSKQQVEQSEQLFKSIAINIPNSLIIVIDKEHRFVTIEGDLMAKMGFTGKDYAGKHPTEVAPPERYEATKDLYERVLSGEQFSIERKGSTGNDFMVHFVPLKNEQDEVYAGLIIALDITDIKQAEEKSAKLAAIVASSNDAIISKTLEGIITSWNEAAERMYGYTEAEMIGQPILKLIPEDLKEEETSILTRLRNGELVEHFETKRLTKDKKLLDVSLTISPVRDKQGHIIGVSKIARDISERKQDDLRKNDFIGMVSHELKTPLTSLSALIQVANVKLKSSPDRFLAEAMDKASLQVRKMSNMINGFLNISRLESGKIMISKHHFDLNDLIREVISETQLTVSSHEIHFIPGHPVFVEADREKIGSVISNLLSNAVKYSPKGKDIDVNCEILEGAVRVSVKDKGIGIKAEDQERLFERYYRVKSNDTRHVSGFGIGLYLSAEIIDRHEGKIGVESKTGEGSVFFFTLPLS